MESRRVVTVSLLGITGLLAIALAAGCGSGSGGSAQPTSPSPSLTSPAASPSPTEGQASPSASAPTSSAPAATPSKSTGGTADLTLTGTVAEGVEARCLILQTSGKDYLLLLPDTIDRAKVQVGARVVVHGRVETGVMSYCQQGTPLQVSSVSPA